MAGLDERIEIEGCDTIAKLFWHQVKVRDGRTAFREKKLGIWRATSWRDYGERARSAGFDRHVVKPVSFDAMRAVLSEAHAGAATLG